MIELSNYSKNLSTVYSYDVPGEKRLFYYVSVHVVTDYKMVFTINRINARG